MTQREIDHIADIGRKVSISCAHENDLIFRQAAIDSLHGYFDGMLETDTWSPCDVYGLIELLPSAQPEIIRCKDCKHWREGTAFSYCDKLYGMGVLDALDYMVAEDDYCSMAERRTDERRN